MPKHRAFDRGSNARPPFRAARGSGLPVRPDPERGDGLDRTCPPAILAVPPLANNPGLPGIHKGASFR